ncbi:MAG: putative Holliday junction resolvase [Chlamydiales bacterium]
MNISGAIGIDHGTKRTGFAVTDALRIHISPLGAFHGPGDDPGLIEHIATLLDERDVAVLVVGMPYNMDGSTGPRAESVLAFMRALSARFPKVEVLAHDERLSTKEAEELLRDSGLSAAKRRQQRDSWSALVILQDWIRAGEPRPSR